MRGNIGSMMKQAEAMQRNMQKAQEEIALMEVTGESGGGMVKVTMNGRHEVKRVQIEPAVVGEDREMLEDLVAAAINDAVRKVETETQQRMSGVMAGMKLPPGMKMPFEDPHRREAHSRSRAPHRGVAHAARGRPEKRAAHGVPPAAGRPCRCGPARGQPH